MSDDLARDPFADRPTSTQVGIRNDSSELVGANTRRLGKAADGSLARAAAVLHDTPMNRGEASVEGAA